MTGKDIELNWTTLNEMTAEVIQADGPGSSTWKEEGSVVQKVNDAFMNVLRENNGKVPGELEGVPALIITTTGAKSGQKRAIPLAYQSIDGRVVIIASMGGAKRNPPWYHNLVQNPGVVVEKDGETYNAQAIVTEGEDRAYLFQQICENLPVFAEYKARTERQIPVIELQR
jgi:deazaflavin-dependent oxidoreductase (nitroreductase family)